MIDRIVFSGRLLFNVKKSSFRVKRFDVNVFCKGEDKIIVRCRDKKCRYSPRKIDLSFSLEENLGSKFKSVDRFLLGFFMNEYCQELLASEKREYLNIRKMFFIAYDKLKSSKNRRKKCC